MGIRRQIEQDVFSHERRKVDHFGPGKFGVNGKLVHLDVERKRLETANATQLNRLGQRPINPKRTFGNPHLEGVAKGPGAARLLRIELGNRAIFLALEMESFGRYLA